jgi:hypothetical protein
MLRDHADRLLDTNYVDDARLVAIEFVNMMAELGRLEEAARVLAYLETTGGFGELARETLVAEAVSKVAANPRVTEDGGRDLDARQALAYMREVLDELAGPGRFPRQRITVTRSINGSSPTSRTTGRGRLGPPT